MDPQRIGTIAASIVVRYASTWELAAIPMFIWMGEIIFRTDISDRLFRGLAPFASRIPGRLLHTNILGCTLFAAVSGSSAATAATVGKITLAELDAQVAELRHELRFSSAVPISHWIRCADTLKRQADQHHNASDLDMQYLCLAKCDMLLSELMPREHAGWHKLDRETRAQCRRHAALIHELALLTRDALLDARGDAAPATQPPFSPSSQAATPTRSSFRQASRVSKHVSFAEAPPTAKKAPWSPTRALPTTWAAPTLPLSPPLSLAGQPPPWSPPLTCPPLSPPLTSPVVQPPCIPSPRPRRLRRRPSERLFLTADPPVSLPVARGVPRHGL